MFKFHDLNTEIKCHNCGTALETFKDPTCNVDSPFQLCDSVFLIIFIQTETYHDFMKDSSSDLIEPLMPPMVRIQGGRNRLSSEICSYSDYEFPLDEAWEIAPRNRLVDSLINLNNLCSAALVLGLYLQPPR